MKLLILGGTRFLGHHLVQSAVRSGHEVAIFTRGITAGDELPASVERLTGDRDGNLNALQGRKWDAVIDTSGYVPRIVRQSAQLLADAAALMAADIRRALNEGLTFRPLADTLRDTAAWDAGRPSEAERKAGLSENREKALLSEWKERLIVEREEG
jgi:hypothetical protein